MNGVPTGIRRRTLLLGGSTAVVAALTGCGSTAALPVAHEPPATTGQEYRGKRLRLDFWNGFTGGDGPPMQSLVDQFNAAHPNIEVRSNSIRWDEYYRKV